MRDECSDMIGPRLTITYEAMRNEVTNDES